MASASGKNRYLDMCGSYCALERRSEGPLVSQFGMSQHGLREVALEIAASGPSRFMSAASREGLARILRGCETTSTHSTGLPLVFFASCGVPRPMNCTSPRAQVVFAGLPSIDSDIPVVALI